jgi:glutamyl-tRNA synthetase
MTALAALVDLSRISRAPARFDPADLETLNARLLHETPYAEVAARLEALGIAGGEVFWLAVRGNLVRLADAKDWWQVVSGDIAQLITDADFSAKAAALLPAEPWDEGTWALWTEAVKSATGAKGKALFMPLRQALTGLDHGPELKLLLPMIGRERALRRLGA